MASSQWSRATSLLNAMLEADPADPEAWLDDRCGEDAALRVEVWSLWRAYEEGPLSGDMRGADWLGASGAVPASVTDAPASVFESGARIGAYRVTGEIGVGGMSVVYRAERDDGNYDQTVAIKLLQRRLHADDADARFRAERQVLASLDHPNIARLLDGGVTEGGRPYLVMEHVDGLPITQYAEAHALDLDARLDLLLQVADAVQGAHGSLVVHRDLKPSNVLVTETEAGPQVKLLDFGIAKLLDDSLPVTRPVTRTGHHLMTPSYAAPEQIRRAEVTVATDVYQLGVLAYELLTGGRPFDMQDKRLTEVERLVVETDPARPSRAATSEAVPPRALKGDLDTILLQALRKAPGRRYRSVEALAADLRRHRRREPIHARTATLGYRTRKFVQRHRWGLATTVGGVLLMAAALVAVLHERNQAQQEARKAEQVSAFLVDLFEAADPNESQGDTLTARTLLQRGRDRVSALDDEPAVQAEMMHVLGQTHRRLARYEAADTLLRGALDLRSSIHGDAHPATLESLSALALLRRDRGDYPAADTLLRNVIRVRRALRGETDSSVVRALMHRGFVQRRRDDLPGAEKSLREALDAKRARADAPDLLTAELLFNQAAVLREQDRHAAALPLQRRSLDLVRQRTDGPHPGVEANLGNLALLRSEQSDYAAADSLYRAAIEQATALYGPEHPQGALWTGNLGTVHLEQFQYAPADSLFRRALAIDRAVYEMPHPRAALHLDNLADTHSEAGRYAIADSTYRAALRMMGQVYAPLHPRVANTLRDHGQLLMRAGRIDSAAATLERSVAMYRETRPEDHPELETARLRLATAQLRRGRLSAADSIAHAVLGRSTAGDSSHVRIGQSLHVRGTVARRRGQLPRADSLYSAARQAYRAAGPGAHWWTAVVQMRRAQGQKARGDYATAELLLVRAHDRLCRERGTPDHYTKQARRALASLYGAWRPAENADRYRRSQGALDCPSSPL
ncbi:tetratricopeptide repeat protein [Salinibacter sp.]|uniref:tetratricopeptide repeat protein n=1 Tax=Salinibacter sp. TaxID=2065818 RepID=UPI0021E9423D|nr:serine/threonine-protein kinase [Salinibacter sp.]